MTYSQKNRLKAGALSFAMAFLFVGGFICPSVDCLEAGFGVWTKIGVACWLILGVIVIVFEDSVDRIFENGAGGFN